MCVCLHKCVHLKYSLALLKNAKIRFSFFLKNVKNGFLNWSEFVICPWVKWGRRMFLIVVVIVVIVVVDIKTCFQVTTMAFLPGLKKQINKANQFMSEKISGVEGTKVNRTGHIGVRSYLSFSIILLPRFVCVHVYNQTKYILALLNNFPPKIIFAPKTGFKSKFGGFLLCYDLCLAWRWLPHDGAEDGHLRGPRGGSTDQDQGVPPAKPNRQGKDGGREGKQCLIDRLLAQLIG